MSLSFQPIKTAVIGYGFSAKTFHLPFIRHLPAFELTAISSSQETQVKSDYANVEWFSSAEELIVNSSAELVIITAPNHVHFELAQQALLNNKHVIIEKPFVTNTEQGEELIALAKQKNLVLSVYHNRRWDGDFLTVKKLIQTGRFGDVRHFESHFDRFRPQVRQRWREQADVGGGILFDLGPHLLDQALQLFGVPKAVTAQCLMMRPGSNNIDYFNITLHYPNMIAVLHADLFSAGPNPRFSVRGSEGSFEKVGLDPQEARLIAGERPTKASWSDEIAQHYGTFYNGEKAEIIPTQRGGYQHYFTGVSQAIRENKIAPVTAQDALWNIKLIELAMESNLLQKTLPVC